MKENRKMGNHGGVFRDAFCLVEHVFRKVTLKMLSAQRLSEEGFALATHLCLHAGIMLKADNKGDSCKRVLSGISGAEVCCLPQGLILFCK